MIILDLFAGAGGFSCGFKQVFPDAIFIGVDKDLTACLTYAKNISKHVFCIDIYQAWNWVLNRIQREFGQVTILIGSPPCQGFSGMNINGDRAMDPTLINTFMKIKKILKPRWWVMEESPFADRYILKRHRKYIKACDHGLYHKRLRLVAGNYLTVYPTNPKPIKHPTPTAEEVKAFKRTAKHDWKHAKNVMSWFGRKMTSWELQILMGFPPGYEFAGNYAERCRQIGNAVCPPVSRAIALSIKNQPTLKSFMRVPA